jgi:hypothetical protein
MNSCFRTFCFGTGKFLAEEVLADDGNGSRFILNNSKATTQEINCMDVELRLMMPAAHMLRRQQS